MIMIIYNRYHNLSRRTAHFHREHSPFRMTTITMVRAKKEYCQPSELMGTRIVVMMKKTMTMLRATTSFSCWLILWEMRVIGVGENVVPVLLSCQSSSVNLPHSITHSSVALEGRTARFIQLTFEWRAFVPS